MKILFSGRPMQDLFVNLQAIALFQMNPTFTKAHLSFSDGILSVQFAENTIIEVEDIIYIYCFGIQESNGKPYGVLFDSSTNHELSEEAIVYLGNTALSNNIIAIAYISQTIISKIRLSLFLIFERPPIKPKIFAREEDALLWLIQQVEAKYNAIN